MTVSLKHRFFSPLADEDNANWVRPSNWNDQHNLTGTATRVLGFDNVGNATEIVVGAGLSLASNTLQINLVRRAFLGADLNIYLSPAGNDTTGNGSSPLPWKTLNKALKYIASSIDAGGIYAVNINMADGTYLDGAGDMAEVRGPMPGSYMGINFLTTGPNGVTIDCTDAACLYVWQAGIYLSRAAGATGGFTFINRQANGKCIFADQGASIQILAPVTFGAGHATAIHNYATSNGYINLGALVSTSGNYGKHMYAEYGGVIQRAGAQTTNTVGVTTAGTAFVHATRGGSVFFAPGQLFTYQATTLLTGKKYQADLTGFIETGGQVLPGTVAGTAATGGLYA